LNLKFEFIKFELFFLIKKKKIWNFTSELMELKGFSPNTLILFFVSLFPAKILNNVDFPLYQKKKKKKK